MSPLSRLPKSARGFHGMTRWTITAVLLTGFAIGATPVALVGGTWLLLWLRHQKAVALRMAQNAL